MIASAWRPSPSAAAGFDRLLPDMAEVARRRSAELEAPMDPERIGFHADSVDGVLYRSDWM